MCAPKESDTMFGLSEFVEGARLGQQSRVCGPWDSESGVLVPPSSCDKTAKAA